MSIRAMSICYSIHTNFFVKSYLFVLFNEEPILIYFIGVGYLHSFSGFKHALSFYDVFFIIYYTFFLRFLYLIFFLLVFFAFFIFNLSWFWSFFIYLPGSVDVGIFIIIWFIVRLIIVWGLVTSLIWSDQTITSPKINRIQVILAFVFLSFFDTHARFQLQFNIHVWFNKL